jgi:hypothetical protein
MPFPMLSFFRGLARFAGQFHSLLNDPCPDSWREFLSLQYPLKTPARHSYGRSRNGLQEVGHPLCPWTYEVARPGNVFRLSGVPPHPRHHRGQLFLYGRGNFNDVPSHPPCLSV